MSKRKLVKPKYKRFKMPNDFSFFSILPEPLQNEVIANLRELVIVRTMHEYLGLPFDSQSETQKILKKVCKEE